jgi:hypothetical protein
MEDEVPLMGSKMPLMSDNEEMQISPKNTRIHPWQKIVTSLVVLIAYTTIIVLATRNVYAQVHLDPEKCKLQASRNTITVSL